MAQPQTLTRTALAVLLLAGLCALPRPAAYAQTSGLLGYWQEPGGSVIQIVPCGSNICLRLVGLGKEPYTVDGQNPDPAKKTRPLCNLEIGSGFHMDGGDHAEGGSLYDPKSGKTYKGTITVKGDSLSLRGYVGFKAFGRSETWTRSPAAAATCPKA